MQLIIPTILWYPTKQNLISVLGVFPLVYVWVRQWEAWKLHPYNSDAEQNAYFITKSAHSAQFGISYIHKILWS